MIRQRIQILALLLTAGSSSLACERTADDSDHAAQATEKKEHGDQTARWQAELQQAEKDQQLQDLVLASLRNEQRGYVRKVQRARRAADDQIAILQNGSRSATGAAKVEFDRMVQELTIRRDALQSDVAAIANAAPSDWVGVKAKADVDLDESRKALRVASARTKRTPRGAPAAR